MRKAMAMFAVLAVVLVGCGSDKKSGSNTTAASGKAAAASSTTAASGGGYNAPATTAAATPSRVPAIKGKVNAHGTKSVADGGSLEVELDDYYFGPTYIRAKAGSKITLELKNEGNAKHNFTLKSAKVNVDLDPGKSQSVKITVPPASTASFFCEYHQKGGMQGSFIVT